MRMASSARATVKAFVEVERADLVITLENFNEVPLGTYNLSTSAVEVKQTRLDFDVVANNVGRSSALITHVSSGWFEKAEPDQPAILLGPPKKYVVNAGKSANLSLTAQKYVESLKTERFLHVFVSYKSPLRSGERLIRACFEVHGVHSNVPYREHRHDDSDQGELQRTIARRELWQKLAGKFRSLLGRRA